MNEPLQPIPDDSLPSQAQECPAHGPYLSRQWSIPLPTKALSPQWTGCPECSMEHLRWRRGGPRPALDKPHHPEG